MKQIFRALRVILTILGLVSAGCAVDVTAARGGESISVRLKPATQPADGSSSSKGI